MLNVQMTELNGMNALFPPVRRRLMTDGLTPRFLMKSDYELAFDTVTDLPAIELEEEPV